MSLPLPIAICELDEEMEPKTTSLQGSSQNIPDEVRNSNTVQLLDDSDGTVLWYTVSISTPLPNDVQGELQLTSLTTDEVDDLSISRADLFSVTFEGSLVAETKVFDETDTPLGTSVPITLSGDIVNYLAVLNLGEANEESALQAIEQLVQAKVCIKQCE